MLAKVRPLMATATKAKPAPAPAVPFSTAVERDDYVQYNHTDACHHLRWTAKESYEYMYARPWSRVVDFYAKLVSTGAGAAGLAQLFGKDEVKNSKTFYHYNAQDFDFLFSFDVMMFMYVSHISFYCAKCRFFSQLTSASFERNRKLKLAPVLVHRLDLRICWSRSNFMPFISFTEDHQIFLPQKDYTLGTNGEDFLTSSEKQMSTTSPKKRGGRWERANFKIVLSYHGGSFNGWQKQPGLNTVQGLVEKYLGQFVDERKAKQLRERSLPIEGCATVAGRTDKGVTALQQVCSFYTWRKDIKPRDIEDVINETAPDKLRSLHVSEVSREFHPNFSAKWRRYLYILPLDKDAKPISGEEQSSIILENPEYDVTPLSFNVANVDKIIRQLEGKLLSYKIFARDTQASRSIGPPTECFMFHSRAAVTKIYYADENCKEGMMVMCVELVANRFLRKMVRVLVATAIREAAAGTGEDALLNLMEATCRRATAPPAPPEGLCLVDVGYEDFNKQRCFIVD